MSMANLSLALFSHLGLSELLTRWVTRLFLAAVLGGIIGLERALKRRPAGLRTNMFICFGSAMFTILSEELAEGFMGDHTRIAAQIIPGIGFIGAGSILHAKGGVSGLTTAATLFVVAAIGMACGGGLYLQATFATGLIILALQVLGWTERRFNLKPMIMNYIIVTSKTPDDVVAEVNVLLEDSDATLQGMRMSKVDGKEKLIFSVDATRVEHKQLTDRFQESDDLRNFVATPGIERD
jgi:putative Mg2+ transporter-C (MgtC) family protein